MRFSGEEAQLRAVAEHVMEGLREAQIEPAFQRHSDGHYWLFGASDDGGIWVEATIRWGDGGERREALATFLEALV